MTTPIDMPPTMAPQRFPTPPKTTTMNESMMYDCPKFGLTLVNWLSATPAMPAIPEPSPKVIASTHSLRMPIALAMARFCETALISRPIRVRFSTTRRAAKTSSVKITI